MSLPIIMTAAGLQPQDPSSLLAQVIAYAAAQSPGYTANLPGSLVEDISSTDVGALIVIDQAQVDLVNSMTPYGANQFILNQLGQIYGVQPGQATNTSVYLVFSGPVGFALPQGFTVSDGTYQYTTQEGGVILSGGQSAALYAVATISGTWAVPANSVTQLITSVPSGIVLTVNNPTAGTPSSSTQTEEQYRAAVLQAGLASAQGMPRFLRTMLGNVAGVQPRLVSIQQGTGGWKVLVGGGDPYAVAYAIFTGIFDVANLVGSVMSVAGITQANPGVVTTTLNHGLTTGQTAYINGATGMTAVNGAALTVTVIDQKNFSIGINTSGYPAYINGGVVTPNSRNQTVQINDFPDTYTIPFVIPPQQTVTVTATWNTDSPNYVSPTAISQLAGPALLNYINGIYVGQPINELSMQNVFQTAVASVLPVELLSKLVFSVTINGIVTSPAAGTQLVYGDAESYFFAVAAGIVVQQG